MNTEISSCGQEFYSSELYIHADSFIESEMGGDESKLGKRFRQMLFYIADRIPPPDRDDIFSLDALFYSYVKLCCKYERLPTLDMFCILAKIHRSTLDDWMNERYRCRKYYTVSGEPITNIGLYKANNPGAEYTVVTSDTYADTVKGWKNVCKGFVLDELSNSTFVNSPLIFVGKSAYGMREADCTGAKPTETKRQLSTDELIMLDDKSDTNE